jgi:REP element-mobilizing transposase RayT
MPRPPRPELAGGIHHVYSRGAVRQPIFIDDLDRQRYLSLLARVVARLEWRCLSYCLMGNHMHLLIETPHPNLGRGVQLLHGNYGWTFNRRHAGSGHVFGARFGSELITTDAQLWVTVSYIVHNPVKAGLSPTPEAWPWSSHTAVLSRRWPRWLAVARLLAHFGQVGGDPLQRYAEFIAANLKKPKGV